jgi:hypothetical protein
MRRTDAPLPTEGAGRESRGDTQGINICHNTAQDSNDSFSFGNTCGGQTFAPSSRIHADRRARRQARCASNRRDNAFTALRNCVRGFDDAAKAVLRKAEPSNDELRSFVDQAYASTDTLALKQRLHERALELSRAEIRQVEIMKTLDKEWSTKGHGWVPATKPDGVTRLILENWNSIKYWSERKYKVNVNVIEATRKRYEADILMGVEHQTNFSKAPEDAQFHDVFGFGE